jgi:hypothetical protein
MKQKRGRYGNVNKPVVDGHRFDSDREAKRYGELRLLECYDKIYDLKLQPRYKIVIGGVPVLMRSERYPNGRQLTYVADFSYVDVATDEKIIEDVKMQSGHKTGVYKIKRALMEAMGYRIHEV